VFNRILDTSTASSGSINHTFQFTPSASSRHASWSSNPDMLPAPACAAALNHRYARLAVLDVLDGIGEIFMRTPEHSLRHARNSFR
jgi:hypothetical protein